VIVLADLGILAAGSLMMIERFQTAGVGLVAWTACVALMGFASIQTASGPQLGMDMPLLLAIGYLYGPIVAGVVAFVAFIDVRELHGSISLTRALFNRAQTSLSVLAASTVFYLMGAGTDGFPQMAFGALVAVGVDSLANYALVVGVMVLHEGASIRHCLRRLRVGSFGEFALTYVSFGLLSVLLAEVFLAINYWGLVLFALPTLLGHRAMSGTGKLERAEKRLRTQTQAMKEAASHVVDERRDERLAVAAGLHDDVLPPLFKVHLMGQVLREDLATGRLLALEDDVPELVRATDDANEAVRTIIRSLRSSPLGAAGLPRMLDLLVRQLESQTSSVRFRLETEEVAGGSPIVQLLAYQVAREAIRNALRHAHATMILVSLQHEEDSLRLLVEDDGMGFVPESVDSGWHFGLALMRERVDLAGGVIYIDSAPGRGTRVVVRLPRQ
jgi:signal transduction histidine kinase